MPKRDRPPYRLAVLEQARLGISLSLLVLIVISFVSYFSIQRLNDESAWVDHSYQILAGIDSAISSIRDAETAQRGFLLTQDSSFLQPYYGAEQNCMSSLMKIKVLTKDNQLQQQQSDSLIQLSTQKFEILKEGFTTLNDSDYRIRQKIVLSLGNKTMEQIRTLVGQIKMVETELLKERKAVSDKYARTSQIVMSMALLFTIIIISIAFFVFQNELKERKRIVSELQSYQIALQDKIQLLNASNLELEQFAYVASHDLQEPLRKIIAFSDRLTTRYKNAMDGDALNYIERIATAANRMRKLIEDLLNYSKMSRASMQMKDVDLNKILKVVVDDLEVSIRNENALVEIGTLPVIKGEEVQLRQLFQNLLSNALKFTTPGVSPHVEINASMISGNELQTHHAISSQKKYYQINVKDNGIGFEEKYTDKIFVIFQRLHGRNEYEGTGIGLAICKKIAENHGGFISVNSYLGQGTTFNVILATA